MEQSEKCWNTEPACSPLLILQQIVPKKEAMFRPEHQAFHDFFQPSPTDDG